MEQEKHPLAAPPAPAPPPRISSATRPTPSNKSQAPHPTLKVEPEVPSQLAQNKIHQSPKGQPFSAPPPPPPPPQPSSTSISTKNAAPMPPQISQNVPPPPPPPPTAQLFSVPLPPPPPPSLPPVDDLRSNLLAQIRQVGYTGISLLKCQTRIKHSNNGDAIIGWWNLEAYC